MLPRPLGHDLETERVAVGSGMRSEQIGGQRAQVVQQDRRLLVPVGIELHPSLLHEHAAEVPGRIERVAREIAFHDVLS